MQPLRYNLATRESRNVKYYAHMNNRSLQNTEEEPISAETIQTAPAHRRGTFHRRQPLYTEKHKVSCSGFLPKSNSVQHSCSYYIVFYSITCGQHASLYAHGNRTRQQSCSQHTAICNQRIKKHIESRTHEQPLVAEHRGGTDSTLKRPQPHPPHTRGTFHRRLQPLYTEKHKVSCSGFPRSTSPMQQSCSHYIAICNQRIKKHIESRTHEQTLVAEHRGGTDSTLKRPQPHPPHRRGTFHRRLQPLYTEKHQVSCSGCPPNTSPMQQSCSQYTAICNQRIKKHIESRTHEQPPVAEHRGGTDSTLKRPQPHQPHTRGTFHRRLQPLYTEKHKVSCSGFPRSTSPMQQSCSQYTAICNQRIKKRIESRTHEQPLVAEHRGGTDSTLKRPQPHQPHTRGTFHRRLQPLYTEKHKVLFRAPAFSPNQTPCNIHAAITLRSATRESRV